MTNAQDLQKVQGRDFLLDVDIERSSAAFSRRHNRATPGREASNDLNFSLSVEDFGVPINFGPIEREARISQQQSLQLDPFDSEGTHREPKMMSHVSFPNSLSNSDDDCCKNAELDEPMEKVVNTSSFENPLETSTSSSVLSGSLIQTPLIPTPHDQGTQATQSSLDFSISPSVRES